MNDEVEYDKEFEQAWETADWIFKNDKQDAQYFYLLGRRAEIEKVSEQLDSVTREHESAIR